MNYFLWIFTGLLAVNLILYIISVTKNISLIEKITKVCFLPFITGIAISLLTERLPDSIHTIIILSLSMLLIICSEILFTFEKKHKMNFIARLFFILNPYIWFELYRSIFFIYKIPVFLHILGALLTIAIFVVIYIFSGRKQKPGNYVMVFFCCAGLSILTYTALVTVCTTLKLYSFILLAGSLTLTAIYALYVLQNTKPRIQNEKKYGVLKVILINSAELLICAATVLMIF